MKISSAFFCLLIFLSFTAVSQPEVLGRYEYPMELSDVWGYVDEAGNEYALVGTFYGLSIVDVTNPATPYQVAFFPGLESTWRDIKTWNDHAYVTNESGGGLLIVDLGPLPQSTSLSYKNWIPDSTAYYTAHNLYIDENGFAYIFGADNNYSGTMVLDLNQDPMEPVFMGGEGSFYLHDGVVKGDTLWGAGIYDGLIYVMDVTDKSNPVLISTFNTPTRFAHNCWISDDNNYLFTTDEIKNGFIAAYDVTDIESPERIATWRTSDTAIIPHNTHFHNNFIITSYYTYGVNIIDVTRPHNMIETGHYDTSPDYVYEGFHGAWGAYPYLPSGNLLVSDIEKGLYIFDPNYTRAAYLEGVVTDLSTGMPILFPKITVLGAGLETEGNIVGEYATGTSMAGKYDVVVQKDGYNSKLIQNVELYNGQVTFLDVQLDNYPVGVEVLEEVSMVKVYPNPTTGNISIAGPRTFSGIFLTDIQGRVLEEYHPRDKLLQLNLAGKYTPGVYFIQWKTEASSGNVKVMLH